MATKDWIKTSKNLWVKKGHKPSQFESGVIRIDKIPQPKGYLYYVRTSKNIYKPWGPFKTTKDANNRAKEYMEKH